MANERARRLRKNLTIDEAKLWSELRLLRHQGAHFRRQAPIDSFIVDFVCCSHRLIIEVDGIQHAATEARERDRVRDAYLVASGFQVLRFTNGEVTETVEGVMLEIMAELGLIERPAGSGAPPPLTPPRKGEGEESNCGTNSQRSTT